MKPEDHAEIERLKDKEQQLEQEVRELRREIDEVEKGHTKEDSNQNYTKVSGVDPWPDPKPAKKAMGEKAEEG